MARARALGGRVRRPRDARLRAHHRASACRSAPARRVTTAASSWRQIAESRAGVGPARAARRGAGGDARARSTRWPAATRASDPALAERLAQALNEGERPRGALCAAPSAPRTWRRWPTSPPGCSTAWSSPPARDSRSSTRAPSAPGSPALALADAVRLVDAADVAGALSLEGFAANLGDPAPGRRARAARPSPGAHAGAPPRAARRAATCGQEGAARNLQDPLTYRSTAPAPGGRAPRRRTHALEVLAVELNAAQGNPLVSVEEGTIRLDGRLRGGGALRGPRLRADRARHHADGRLRAQRQAAGHALVGAADRAPRARASPDLGLSILAITAESLAAEASDARPAGLLHRHEHARRRGHRGPRVPPAALGASARRAGRRGRGDRRRRACRRRTGGGRSRRLASRERHRAGSRRACERSCR